MRIPLFFCLLFILNSQLGAQQRTVRGLVTDPSGEPLPGATIAAGNSVSAISNEKGRFILSLPAPTTDLSVRMIGYFSRRILTDTLAWKNNTATLVIVLTPSETALPEVSIQSKPIQTVFEENFQTDLLDYDFAGNNLLMLLKDRKKYLLRRCDLNGNKLGDLPLPVEVTQIHRSCLGDYHLVGPDWAWEITIADERLDTFPRYPAARFHQLVEPCVTKVNNRYVFVQTGPYRQTVKYYYIDEGAPNRHLLALVRNEKHEKELLELHRNILAAYMSTLTDLDKDEILENKTVFSDPLKVLAPENLAKMAESNDLVKAIGYFNMLALDSVYAPLFRINEFLYLFDHENDQLVRFATFNWEKASLPMTYHRAPQWQKDVLVDAVTKRVYGRFGGKRNDVRLREIDLETGQPGRVFEPEALPLVAENFQVYNGSLYCIAQPDVNTPNRKLFKVNLYKFVK